jgi:hypothetical protein
MTTLDSTTKVVLMKKARCAPSTMYTVLKESRRIFLERVKQEEPDRIRDATLYQNTNKRRRV